MDSRGLELIRQGLALLAGSATEEITERLAAADAAAAGLSEADLVRAEVTRASEAAKAAGASPAEIVEVAKKTFTVARRTVTAAAKAAKAGGRGDLPQVLPTEPLTEVGTALLEFRKLIDEMEGEWSRLFAVFCAFDGPVRVYGQRPATMLTHRCGMRSGTAIARDKLATTWRRLPRCLALLQEGKIGMGHLEVAGEAMADALAATGMDAGELAAKFDSVLAQHAAAQSPKQLAATAHEQARRLDADACDNQAIAAHRQRSCRLTLTGGGTGWQLRASGEASGYAIVSAALSALIYDKEASEDGLEGTSDLTHCGGERCRPSTNSSRGNGTGDGHGDRRARGCDCQCVDCQPAGRDQQRYDALIRACQVVASGAGLSTAGARERAKVQIVLTPDTLAGTPGAPPAETNYGQVLTRLAGRVLAKDSLLQRLVTEPLTGKILDLGRTMRCFPKRIADAIKANYRTCQYPGGCDVPVAYTDLHHDGVPWWDGGPTDPDTGKPFCHAHNIQAEIDRLNAPTANPNPAAASEAGISGGRSTSGKPGTSARFTEDQPSGTDGTMTHQSGKPGSSARYREDRPGGGADSVSLEPGIPGGPARYRQDPHRRDWTTHPDAA